MPARTLPNLGLQGFFDPGENGWDTGMNLNLLLLSVLTQGGVISTVSATPETPTEGDVYLFSSEHPTDANKIAIFDDGDWVLAAPLEGWRVYDRSANALMLFSGLSWSAFGGGGGGGGGGGYRFGFSIENSWPEANEVLMRHVLQTTVDFAGDFGGSIARLSPGGAVPLTDQVFTILVNGVAAGTITVLSASGLVAWAGADFIGAAGDEIRVEAPATPDPDLLGLSATFYGVPA